MSEALAAALRAQGGVLAELGDGLEARRPQDLWPPQIAASGPRTRGREAEYRLLLPEEVQRMFETGGFEVVGMYDNREFQPTDLTGRTMAGPDIGGMRGRKLYFFARKQ